MEPERESEVLFAGESIRPQKSLPPYRDISISHPTWTRLLLLTGLVTIFGASTPVGYHIGVINTPRPVIQAFLNTSFHAHYNLVLTHLQLDTIYSTIVSIFLVGGTIGSFSGSLLADKIGRKGGMVVASIIGVTSGVVFGVTKWAVELLLVGRFLAGLSSGLITAIMPMYLMELAPARLKGAVGAFCPLGVTVGVLLGQVLSMRGILGNENYWPVCLACPASLQALCALLVLVLPESPKYLFVIRKKPHLALEQLKRLRNLSEECLSEEINFLRMEEQENLRQGDTWNIKKVLKTKSLTLPLLLMCSLQAGQQLSGVNAVFYYSSIIFERAGLSETSSEIATIGTGVCNISMALVSVLTMSRFSRRLILQMSLVSTICMLCVLGLSLLLINTFSWMPYICIMAVLGYVLCYGLGLGPIPYFIGSELFEVGPRSSAMALGSMANWAGNFVVGLTFPLMNKILDAWSFFIFAAVGVGLLIFIRLYFPETKGKNSCEIARLVSQGLKSKPLIESSTVVNNATSEMTNLTDKTHL